MKHPRKVALINVYDYPRELYSAYWSIDVQETEEGVRWAAHLFGYEPQAWQWQGKVSDQRPDVPWPVYPVMEAPTLPPMPAIASAAEMRAYNETVHRLLNTPEQRAKADAFRKQCSEIYEAHPKPVYLIEEAVDVVPTRDEADTAAQTWVLERIEGFRRANPPALSDDDIEVLIAEWDRARHKADFGVVDRIRGKLKAHGVAFTEPDKVAAPGRTSWSRGKPKNKQSGHAGVFGPAGMLGEVAVVGTERLRELIERLFNGLSFALGMNVTLRNNRLDEITALIDAGGSAGLWRIYDGSRPATCGTATTLLAELTFSDPSAAAASGGDWTANEITADSSANATGTATWGRKVDSTGTCVQDHDVGTSGSDLNLNSVSISVGQQVSITSAVITEGNA